MVTVEKVTARKSDSYQ